MNTVLKTLPPTRAGTELRSLLIIFSHNDRSIPFGIAVYMQSSTPSLAQGLSTSSIYVSKTMYARIIQNLLCFLWSEKRFLQYFINVYLFIQVAGLIKLRKIKTLKDLRNFLTRYVTDVIQSTIFLGMHGVLFMPACCSGRYVKLTK